MAVEAAQQQVAELRSEVARLRTQNIGACMCVYACVRAHVGKSVCVRACACVRVYAHKRMDTCTLACAGLTRLSEERRLALQQITQRAEQFQQQCAQLQVRRALLGVHACVPAHCPSASRHINEHMPVCLLLPI